MNTVLLSCYGSNFEEYGHLLECMEASGAGAELAISPEKAGFNRKLIDNMDSFRGKDISFHGPFEQIEAASPEGSAENCRFLTSYEIAFPIAQAFGAKYVVMHTNQRDVPEAERAYLQSLSLATVKKVAKRAREEGVELLLENVGEPEFHSVLFNQDEYIGIFDEIQSINALFDVGHALINNWDLEKVISALSGRIKAYHLHSNDGELDLHWPISDGVLNVKVLTKAIKKYTPDAAIVLEYAPSEFVTPLRYKKDAEMLKEYLKAE